MGVLNIWEIKSLITELRRYPPINTVFVKDDVVRRADSAIKGVL